MLQSSTVVDGADNYSGGDKPVDETLFRVVRNNYAVEVLH